MILSAAIGEFILARRVDGRAKATLSWYQDMLKPFQAVHGLEQLEIIKPSQIRQYIDGMMRANHYSPETVKTAIRALHGFWAWASVEYDIKNPMGNIAYPSKPKQRQLQPLTADDLRKLFTAAGQTPNSERDSLILWVLLDTGIRVQGLIELRWRNINLEQRTMYIVEKGSKGRIAAFSHGTAYLLRKWQFYHGGDEYVFTGPLAPAVKMKSKVKRISRAANVKDVFPHALRHHFAMNWMESGGEIVALKNQLGHTHIETTIEYYLRYAPSTLVQAHKGTSLAVNLVKTR